MNPVKIIFFDIDGTLLQLGITTLSPKTQYALDQLHQKGIPYYACSGRPSYILPKFNFDGWCCYNGAFCQQKDGTILFSRSLDPEQLKIMLANAEKMGKKVVLANADDMAKNGEDADLQDYIDIAKAYVPVDPHFEDRLKQPVYQAMVAIRNDQLDELLAGTHDLAGIGWYPKALDIVHPLTDKGEAIRIVLDKLNLKPEDTLAFGDGANDIAMLKAAGTGVAMGNALPEVKAIADTVCPSVDEDGVYQYLVDHQIIDPMD